MAEIRAVVADDEPLARRGVRQLAGEHGDLRIVGEAATGVEAVRLVRKLSPDLLLLDVEMPELDGFGVLLYEVPRPPLVVFVTAFEDFALRAFEVDAVDYLLKPVSGARFAACLERVRARIAAREEEAAHVVVVPGRAGDRVLQPEEIDWIEADDYYAAVHAAGGRSLVRESLASLEARLPEGLFLRVHRSALVNLTRIRTLLPADRGGGAVELRDGTRVRVSRRCRAVLQERLRGRSGRSVRD